MKLSLNKHISPRCLRCLSGAFTLTLAAGLHAQTSTNAQPVRLPEVLIQGESEASESVQAPFLPDVQGTKINAGKKTSVLDLDQLPRVVNNNYRQALSQTPGLLLSEETTPLVSIGYRGLNPHRAQFTQVLKDGIPIHADMLGYPEAYYTPPLDTVDRIEFLHGGASLMYGPQPGGALNYVTHMPRTDKEFSARTQHILGSDNLYSTFNSVDGTVGRLGYYAYFNHRQADGFRTANSDYDLYTGSAKLVLDAQTDSRWIFTFDGYEEEHGEPGGLSFTAGPGYHVDRDATTRFNDRFRLERYFASLAYEKDFSETTQMTVQAWGGYYQRFSKRQTLGGFGTVATGGGNTIENQEFYTKGIEARLRHDWEMGENVHTLAGGFMVYHTDSPRVDKTGLTPDADDGAIATQSDRSILYAPVFVENKFQFGKFSVTPGLRVENYVQEVQNFTTGRQVEDREIVPLVGLGLAYELTETTTAYANASQAYRPKIFTESVPQGGGTIAAADLDPGSSWQYEIGYRGQLDSYFTWDTSFFLLDFDNQIGTVGASIINVGRSIHRGWEGSVELDVIGLADKLNGSDNVSSWGSFSLYGNLMLLDAEIVSRNTPTSPQYAPDYLLRTGGIYRFRDRVKVALLGTFVGQHFADDANTAAFRVPAYMTWDLTAEVKVYKDMIGVVAGINNLFDEDYYSRIRGDGIDPSYGRNYYAGLSFAF